MWLLWQQNVFLFLMEMEHFAEKNNTRSKKKLISVCNSNKFYIFLIFSQTQYVHLLPFAKVHVGHV